MTQLTLLSDTPIARRRDPDTSKQAAAEITASGARARQQTMTLGAVKTWNGSTSAELGQRLGWDRFTTARRLPELRAQGFVENGEPRPCTVTGKQSLTWWIRGTAPKVAA